MLKDVKDFLILVTKMEERKCKLCGSNKTYFIRSIAYRKGGSYNWHKYDNGYICHYCYLKIVQKAESKMRNGKLSKHSCVGKGFIMEQVVSKYLGVENCNLKTDNLHNGFDLFKIGYGRMDVQGSKVYGLGKYRCWMFTVKKNNDCYFLVGLDKDRKIIIKAWIIPTKDIYTKRTITIMCDTSESKRRFGKYEMKLEQVSQLNDILHSIGKNGCKYLCDVH